MVTGVLFAPPAAATPVSGAPIAVDHLYNLKAAYRARDGASHATQGDVMTAIDASLGFADPPEVINYSYGSDASVDDDGYCRFFDNVVDTFGKTLTLSAGNAGLRAIGTPGIAYNVISVANVNGQGTADRADDTIAPTSSAGPTPGGRKKPDLSALGSQIPTATRTGGVEKVTGTSFAAPAIAGAAARLVDRGTTDPRAVKAVMLNNADDFGSPGWDIDFGWGYFNAARTEQHAADYHLRHIVPEMVERRLFARTSLGPAKATLVWNRHVTEHTSRLTDLDLFLYDERDGRLRDASISSLDNVEQVSSGDLRPVLVVDRAERGPAADELFALAHSGGFEERRGPDVQVKVTTTASASGDAADVRVDVTNTGDLRGHGYEVVLHVPSGARVQWEMAPKVVGSLDPGQTATIAWTLKGPDASALPAIRATATLHAYGFTRQQTR
jgi:hypothetical protein